MLGFALGLVPGLAGIVPTSVAYALRSASPRTGRSSGPAPMVIAVILGPMLERAVRAALELSGGSLTVFVTSPLAAALLALAVVVVALSARGLGRGPSSAVPEAEPATPPASQRR